MRSVTSLPTVAESIRDATAEAMREDDSVVLFGLGVNDPGRVFGTTSGLLEEFGGARVFETPTAENGMMGVAVGAALGGFRPIVTHQRADFFYLAMDQLVNSAAKWRFMFGGQFQVPLVVRLIVGRGWGQGPTHSQNLATWLAHIPGIKVVYPSNSANARTLLLEAIRDDNPVVFIEDRWLHNQKAGGSGDAELSISKAVLRRAGQHVTVVAYGLMVLEVLRAADELESSGVSLDVVDLGTLLPLDISLILKSVSSTRRLLVVDPGPARGSFGEGLIGVVSQEFGGENSLEVARVLALPSIPQPTSFEATKGFYPTHQSIVAVIAELLGVDTVGPNPENRIVRPHDVSGEFFSGPF